MDSSITSGVHVTDFRHGAKILISYSGVHGIDTHCLKIWQGLRFDTYMKFRWYFRYVAARIQMRYPKALVEVVPFKVAYVLSEQEQKRKSIKDRITRTKASITQVQKALDNMHASWSELFPIEQDTTWIAGVKKLEFLNTKLNNLENQWQENQW